MSQREILEDKIQKFAEGLVKRSPYLLGKNERMKITITIEKIAKVVTELESTSNASGVTVEELGFNTRSLTVFRGAGIFTVDQLTRTTIAQLLKIRNCGYGTVSDIRKVLAEHGLGLKNAPPYGWNLLNEDLGLSLSLVRRLRGIGVHNIYDLSNQKESDLLQKGLKPYEVKAIIDRLRANDAVLAS